MLAARTLVGAAALAAVVTTVLVTGLLQYAQLLPEAGTRAAIAAAPLHERTLLVTTAAGDDAADVAELDRQVRDLLAGGLAGVPTQVQGGGYAVSQQLPDHGDADAVVAMMPELADHATLVEGAWPEPVEAGKPVPVAVPAATAADLGLAAGDQFVIHHGIVREDRPAQVVAVFEPHDRHSPHWRIAEAPLNRGGVGPFVVHPDEFAANYQQLASLDWVGAPDPGELAERDMAEVVAGYHALAAEVARLADQTGSGVRIHGDFEVMATRLETATVVNRSGLVLPAALLAAIAGYGLVLVARLLVAQRRGEHSLLRARGASRRQLLGLTTGEAGVVVLPAVFAGAPLGTWLLTYADERAGDRGLGLAADLAPYGWWGPPAAWLIAVAAAACCALALVAPAAGRGRTWLAEQQERSRPGTPMRLLRSGLDVALVVLAILAWTQLRQYGSAVRPRDVGGLGIDPLLVAAPVVAVLAGTAVVLRLLPLATRAAVRLAERGPAFPRLLGAWQADRRPHAGPVLLLVLAVASAVLAPSVAATWQQSQRDQAAHAVGADLRLRGSPDDAGEVAGLPGVTGLVAVHRFQMALPDVGAAELLALDAASAGGVALVRDDLPGSTPAEMFAALAQARPEVDGQPLPADARRLVGEVRFTGADAVTVSGSVARADLPSTEGGVLPSTDSTGQFLPEVIDFHGEFGPVSASHLTLYLADDRGLVHTVPLGRFGDGVARTLDMPLPYGAASLVGVGARVSVPARPDICPHLHLNVHCEVHIFETLDVVPVTTEWQVDLEVVDTAGVSTAVPVADLDLAATADRISDAGGGVSTQIGQDWPEVNAIPIAVTPQVLAATGRELGDEAFIGRMRLELADTVEAVPGVTGEAGIVMDVGHLAMLRLAHDGQALRWQEWLIRSADPDVTASAAEEVGLTVQERAVEQRRLLDDPLGVGLVLTLWAAAAGAALLAAFGLAVDARATALGRQRELAVLHTLGASPPGLSRALVVEQALLAGLGVLVGLAVGVGVAGAMGPSLVLTPAGEVPVPEPLLTLPAWQLAAPTLGLLGLAVFMASLVARRARRELAASNLRIGAD